MDDHTLDTEYAEDLRRIVRKWRISHHHHHLKRADRICFTAPTMTDPVSDGMVRCAWVLCHAYGGAHHVGTVKFGLGDQWMEATHYSEAATADGDVLTRLVVLAHDAAVRISISAGGPRNIRIMLHPRVRSDRNMTNHRTMESAVAALRSRWAPVPVIVPVASPETDKG